MKTIVIALGGNAILRADQEGTAEEQLVNVRKTCKSIADMVASGFRVVITHGNGPQVGNILIQNEEAAGTVPTWPLDFLVAQSQGLIGYMVQQSLENELNSRGIKAEVVTVISQVVVDPADPAFENPTKPVGPFFTPEKAKRLMEKRGYLMKEAYHGWRRVVPSPRPLYIRERETVRRLVSEGAIVITSGGGGIPVVVGVDGMLRGIEAVVDKDLAGQRLALDVGAETFLILTDVENVMLDYGKPTERPLRRVDPAGVRRYLAEGQFPPGSMGPKMEAAAGFVEGGGRRAIITSLEMANRGLAGETGTIVSQED